MIKLQPACPGWPVSSFICSVASASFASFYRSSEYISGLKLYLLSSVILSNFITLNQIEFTYSVNYILKWK